MGVIGLTKNIIRSILTAFDIVKEYMIKGILPIDDLLYSVNCIPVDCDTLDKCPCDRRSCGEPTAHF